ncbi:DUF4129 domain-containing protein [Saliphagus sp. LR7]|uniref:DUF4129 domain-containing protein n=1 Tax=Saliphagus sp. LR7 TaxID=2282654 RepID=UPI001300B240|nr:DUF4129 domain-containing protein [Saliphagus sp. LR7]
MDSGRTLPTVTALLAVLVLALVAPVLETTPIASPYEVPVEGDADSGGPLVSVLFALVIALLELLGIDFEPTASAISSPLAALLEAVLPLLPSFAALLIAGLVLGALVVAAYRLPVSATLSNRLVGRGWEADASSKSTAEEWPPADPDPGVAEAWLAMTAAADPDCPTARTPAEWAEEASGGEFDDDAIADLTSLFREVRYGGMDETPEHRRRANRDLERLEGEQE